MASNDLPKDPAGTVRAGHQMLAVRAYGVDPNNPDDLGWYVFDLSGGGTMSRLTQFPIITDWPIVYQP